LLILLLKRNFLWIFHIVMGILYLKAVLYVADTMQQKTINYWRVNYVNGI